MMRSMRHPPRHDPCPRPLYVEELHIRFPPHLIFFLQRRQSIAAVLGIPLHELNARLLLRQRWRIHVNAQHVAEPQVFADALMDHLLMHAASPRITVPRTHREVRVLELTPNTDHFHAFGGVCVHKKCISHSRKCYSNFPNSIHAPPPPAFARCHRYWWHFHRLCLDRSQWPPAHGVSVLYSG